MPAPPPLRTVHASFDAYSSSIRQRFLPERGCPIGLGVNLSVTATGPATELTSVAQAAPAEVIATSPTVLLCLLRRLADGSRPPTPRGSLHPFGWGDVSTPIRPITGRHWLSPRSSTRSPIGSSYDSLSLAGGLRAYHVASLKPRGLGPASTPVARHLRRGSSEPPDLATCRFGPSVTAACACLWLRRLRRFT